MVYIDSTGSYLPYPDSARLEETEHVADAGYFYKIQILYLW